MTALRLLLLTSCCLIGMPRSSGGEPWRAYANPRDVGFSLEEIEAARATADANRAAAVVAVYRGHVVAAWGAIDRPFKAHSIRKSLAGALYGIALGDRRLSLAATLATLRVDDIGTLTPSEKQATLGDLLASRSGVYHPAAYADAEQSAERPARGSHRPGTHWFYNNWDFNAAETIYERVTGEDLYAAFGRRLARPLGMEDFDARGQLEVLEPSQSSMPAHTFRISARDLARFGQLYLDQGRWGRRQVVPASWIVDSFTAHSETGDRTGYGYLWWTYAPGSLGASYPTLDRMSVYLARGSGGHALFVIPDAHMVVVHRADTDNGRAVAGPKIWALVERLVAARRGTEHPSPRTIPLVAGPLSSNLPPPPMPATTPISPADRGRVVGQYEIAPGTTARVFEHQGRLFMSIPGLGEAELFSIGALSFVAKVESGVAVDFSGDDQGRAVRVDVTVGSRRIRGTRRLE